MIICKQYFLIVVPILKAIKKDLEEEKNQRPQWEIRAEEFRRNAALFEDERADEQAISDALQQEELGVEQFNEFDDDDDKDDLFD